MHLPTPSEFHQHAAAYASQGFHVFPCAPNEKRPLTINGFKEATTDLGQINAWWSRWPQANIAIALPNSGLFCFDVDCKHAEKDGRPIEAELLRLGYLTKTLMATTPTGGRHYIYRLPEGFDTHRGGKLKGIDLLLNNYILVAPSIVDGIYAWLFDPATQQPSPIAPLPQAISDLYHGHLPAGVNFGFERTASEILEAYVPGEHAIDIPAGERNEVLYMLGMQMRKKGLSENAIYMALVGLNQKAKPPLSEEEVLAIHAGILRNVQDDTELYDRLRLFTEELKHPEAVNPDLIAQFTMTPQRLGSRQRRLMVQTGLAGIDHLCTFTRGSLAVIAAPPGAGKTMFALNLAERMIFLGESVVFLSLELRREDIEDRVLGSFFKCSQRELMNMELTPEMQAEFTASNEGMSTRFAVAGRNDPFREVVAAFHHKYGKPPILIIDYGQLLTEIAKPETRVFMDDRTALKTLLNDLAAYAESQSILVLLLAATNRASNKDVQFVAPSRPIFSEYIASARDTSHFEFIAENFLFLETEDFEVKDETGQDCNRVRIVNAKSRSGKAGVSYFLRYAAIGEFREVSEDSFYRLGAELPPPAVAPRKGSTRLAPAAPPVSNTCTLPPQGTGLPRVKLQPTAELLWSLVVRSHMREALPSSKEVFTKLGNVARQLLGKGYITNVNGVTAPGPALPDYKEDHAACVEAIKTKLQKQFAMVFSFV